MAPCAGPKAGVVGVVPVALVPLVFGSRFGKMGCQCKDGEARSAAACFHVGSARAFFFVGSKMDRIRITSIAPSARFK